MKRVRRKSEPTYDENSPAVQSHLNIIQSVIQRMAGNSSACKGWAIALTSAILVLVADKGNPKLAGLAIIPTLLFFGLDSYYLSLEQRFRRSYNGFIDKLHARGVTSSDLYAVVPAGPPWKSFFAAAGSPASWPFYLTLALLAWIAKTFFIE